MSADKKLDALNAAVARAIKERRDYLDAETERRATVKVGEPLYNLKTGVCVGVVSKHYRYHRDQYEGIYDSHHSVEYEYETSPGSRCYDNTSRQVGESFGSHKEAIRRAERELGWLKTKTGQTA